MGTQISIRKLIIDRLQKKQLSHKEFFLKAAFNNFLKILKVVNIMYFKHLWFDRLIEKSKRH